MGFRFTAQEIAKELGVCGWVKNLDDGRVEITAEADQGVLEDFLEKIQKYFAHYIKDTRIEWLKAGGEFDDFSVRY